MAVGKICVVGLGYIGLPTAAVFASRKIQVIGIDVNQNAIDTINRGEIHIVEPDLSFPQQVGEQSDIRVAHCPERVLPGHILSELVQNDRVIGGMTTRCAATAADLYRVFLKGECVLTTARTAEMCKLTENSFRDVNIAFANELSVICDALGIDVWELIRLANRHPRVNILQPGPGVGGHCIAVDPWFIVSSAPEQSRLIAMARRVNDDKPGWVVDKVKATVADFLAEHPKRSIRDVTLACYGLAFKANIDDLRESPAVAIARRLMAEHAGTVRLVEPNLREAPAWLPGELLVSFDQAVAEADIHVLLVDHAQFRRIRPQQGRMIDTRGIW